MSGEWCVQLESPLPATLPAGRPTALYLAGFAWGGGGPVDGLELVVAGVAHRPHAIRMPRFDLPCRRSGFWALVPVGPAPPGRLDLSARVRRGAQTRTIPLGSVTVERSPERGAEPTGELIAVCLATFEPDGELLARQLDSLRAQRDAGWHCLISDDHSSPGAYARILTAVGEDERFTVSRTESRLGFYRNFERAVGLAPAEARWIALCDQDDVWHPDKLAVLRGAAGEATLVYGDARLVDRDGRVLAETMWRGRANDHQNLASLQIANTVSGSAALIRRDVVELALPFPDSPGIEFHDHWLALVALSSGELDFVPRPLYDYVQHGGAVLGGVGAATRSPSASPWRPRAARAAYFRGVVPAQLRALALLVRCGESLTPRKRRALRLMLTVDRSPAALAWLILRPLRAAGGRGETLGSEWELLPGVAWSLLARLLARVPRWPERLLLDTRLPDVHFEQRRLRRWRERAARGD